MKTTRFVVAGALCAWILMAAQAVAADSFSGNWTMMPADTAGKVNFGLVYRRHNNNMNHAADWAPEVFEGLDLSVRGKRDVQFTITREAGRFDCEGYLNNGVERECSCSHPTRSSRRTCVTSVSPASTSTSSTPWP